MYFFAATLIFTVLYLTVSAFAEMDEDEDGEITQEEFIKVNASSNSNERILQLFSSNMCFAPTNLVIQVQIEQGAILHRIVGPNKLSLRPRQTPHETFARQPLMKVLHIKSTVCLNVTLKKLSSRIGLFVLLLVFVFFIPHLNKLISWTFAGVYATEEVFDNADLEDYQRFLGR